MRESYAFLIIVAVVTIAGITTITAPANDIGNVGGKASLPPLSTKQTSSSTGITTEATPTDALQASGCLFTDPECQDNPTDGCDVRNKDFILTADYNFPTGIAICNNNRVVDCQGHTLTGTGLNTGIESINFDSITVRNCIVTNYQDDIRVRDGKGPTITGNTITNAGFNGLAIITIQDGIISNNKFVRAKVLATQVYDTLIQDSTITDSGGPESFGSAIDLRYSDGNTLTKNTIDNNPGNGILLDHSHNNRILSNTITNNGKMPDSPIELEGSGIDFEEDVTNTSIQGNTISRNNNGITLDTGQFNTITGNTIANNLFNGITLEGYISISNADSNTITNNQINNNGENGILLFGGLKNTIQNNQINNNGKAGINISRAFGSQTPDNNILTLNTIDRNGIYGIFLSDAGSEAVNTNEVCFNGVSDFQLKNSGGNTGGQNKCDKADGWNDASKTGCTSPCIQANTTGCGDPTANCSTTCSAGYTCIGYTPGGCGGNCSKPLAVNWAYYTATCQPSNTILIQWGTTMEQDTLGFNVQWSQQKTGTYNPASPFIYATGSGSNYQWPDTNNDGSPTTPKSGIYNWYKVQEITANGPGDETTPFTTERICDEPIYCGGIAGTRCPEGYTCVCPPDKTGTTTTDQQCICQQGLGSY